MKSLTLTLPKTELQLREHSTGLIATLTNADAARDFERGLTVKKIIKTAVPISELSRVTGTRQIAIALDIQLTRLVANLNLKWSVNDSQIKTIVEDIIDKFPNETIEDFVLCFKRARQGEYGELVRLDSAIVFSWIARYLDDKYQVLEDELRNERDKFPHEMPEVEQDGPGYKAFKEYAKSLKTGMKVPRISDADIKRYGQERPVEKTGTGHPRITEAGLEASQRLDLMREYGRQHTDIYTGKPLPGSPTFEQWVKEKQQEK